MQILKPIKMATWLYVYDDIIRYINTAINFNLKIDPPFL